MYTIIIRVYIYIYICACVYIYIYTRYLHIYIYIYLRSCNQRYVDVGIPIMEQKKGIVLDQC